MDPVRVYCRPASRRLPRASVDEPDDKDAEEQMSQAARASDDGSRACISTQWRAGLPRASGMDPLASASETSSPRLPGASGDGPWLSDLEPGACEAALHERESPLKRKAQTSA